MVISGAEPGARPVPLFALCGLSVWIYFSQALRRAGNRVVSSARFVFDAVLPVGDAEFKKMFGQDARGVTPMLMN